ncbi:MAG: HlyD family secretion protein [Micropepsaceae bacterium]
MNEASTGTTSTTATRAARLQSLVQRWRRQLLIGGPLAVLLVAGWYFLTSGRYQDTENAYVQAARVPISTSITGRIVEMRVHENDLVKALQILFVLDRKNYQADVSQWEAALATAQLRVSSLKAEYRSRLASLRSAEQTLGYAQREQVRARKLAADGIVSSQDLDKASHELAEARQRLDTARQAVAATLAELGGAADIEIDQHPAVREAAARLERARLALSYTNVLAPQAGTVTRVDQVQVGSFVNAGQPLFWLVAGEPWVEANFKEDQLTQMRVGQKATVRIDAYGGEAFDARVTSLSPGTGAVFSAIPTQNATGNWVKVVQRLPVRLTLVKAPPDLVLRAGLSAQVSVDTKSDVEPVRGIQ